MVNGTESDGKNLMSSKILIGGIVAQIIMMLGLINVVLMSNIIKILGKHGLD